MNNLWELRDYINEFCNSGKCRYLSEIEKKKFIENTINTYCEDNKWHYSLFEGLKKDYIGINIIEAWRWIADYIPKEKIIVLLGDMAEGIVIEVVNGIAFCELYDQLPFIEFYLTNSEFEYLIGFNHSKCLITMGNACEWLERDQRYIMYYKEKIM